MKVISTIFEVAIPWKKVILVKLYAQRFLAWSSHFIRFADEFNKQFSITKLAKLCKFGSHVCGVATDR